MNVTMNYPELQSDSPAVKSVEKFFRSAVIPILYKRNVAGTLDGTELWCQFHSSLITSIVETPENYVKHSKLSFVEALLSLKQLKSDESLERCVVWINKSKGVFIDPRCTDGAAPCLGVSTRMSILADSQILMDQAKKSSAQYRIEDVLLSMADAYCFEHGAVGDEWPIRLQARLERRVSQKQAYLGLFRDAWKTRRLKKIIEERVYSSEDLPIETKMSRVLIKDLIDNEMKQFFNQHSVTDLDTGYAVIIRTMLTNKQKVERIANQVAQGVWAKIKHIHLYALFTQEEAELAVIVGFAAIFWDDSLPNPIQRRVFNLACFAHWDRIERLVMPHKSRLAYGSFRFNEALVRMSSDETADHSIYMTHVCLISLGVSHSVTRSFISALYKFEGLGSDGPTYDLHYAAEVLIPAVSRFLMKLRISAWRGVVAAQIYNKLFKLLTSEICGGGFRTQIINELLFTVNQPKDLRPTDFQSIRQLSGILNEARYETKTLLKDLAGKGFVVDADIDTKMLVSSNLAASVERYRKHLPLESLGAHKGNAPTEVYQCTSGDLTVELLPWNHFRGVLGCGVHGVCIDFGGIAHKSHLMPRCRNLIVRDNRKIYLWGLLVECDGGEFFLNNFQGSLPSQHRHSAEEIKELVWEVLNKLGQAVYTMDFAFNTISIADDVPVLPPDFLFVPDIRLDVFVSKEGFIDEEKMYALSDIALKVSRKIETWLKKDRAR